MGEAFEAAERAGAGIAGETIITLGNDDLVHRDRRGRVRHHAVRPVRVVSVHGAGDVFMGARSVRLAAPAAMEDAIASGQAAARIVSTPLGERGISFTLGDELSRGHVRRDRKILSTDLGAHLPRGGASPSRPTFSGRRCDRLAGLPGPGKGCLSRRRGMRVPLQMT